MKFNEWHFHCQLLFAIDMRYEYQWLAHYVWLQKDCLFHAERHETREKKSIQTGWWMYNFLKIKTKWIKIIIIAFVVAGLAFPHSLSVQSFNFNQFFGSSWGGKNKYISWTIVNSRKLKKNLNGEYFDLRNALIVFFPQGNAI